MKKNSFGFTLIELLVVISIIGILAALTLVSFGGAQKQARDTQRKSDLNQVKNALENYAGSNNGMYPIQAIGNVTGVCGTGQELDENFISFCPTDPLDGTTAQLIFCTPRPKQLPTGLLALPASPDLQPVLRILAVVIKRL